MNCQKQSALLYLYMTEAITFFLFCTAVSGYFTASCAPGAKEEKLCKQCAGLKDKKCKLSESEPYYGYDGARK